MELFIKDDRIVEVGKHGQIKEPENAKIIDAKNGYISPGLIDIHVKGTNGADVSKVDTNFDKRGICSDGFFISIDVMLSLHGEEVLQFEQY